MSLFMYCYAECCEAVCHYAECRYAECRGAKTFAPFNRNEFNKETVGGFREMAASVFAEIELFG
jgi:hypothetical protein